MELSKRSSKYRKKTIKRYSESFKLGLLDELSRGESTKEELKVRYRLGNETLNTWIKKYNRIELQNRIIHIRKPEELDETKALKKRIEELEKALAQTQLNHLKSAASLSVALDELGYKDEAEFEKKQKAKQSKKR